jgi:nucleotide-binding universal stress UspA family protein
MKKTRKILIVADDSPASVKAIRCGFNLAKAIGARVMLLSVIDPELAAGNPDAGIFPDDALMALKSKTEHFLARMKINYAKNVSTKLSSPIGDIQTTVIKAAVKWKADLIVTGTHDHTGFSKLFNGSISDSIIHQSPVPVYVVPQDK